MSDRWAWLKRHLRGGGLRTLDAGCGSGVFTMYSAKIGNETLGLSFEEKSNRLAQARADTLQIPNVHFVQGDLRQLDTLAADLGRFDQIVCFETIEHIIDDRKLVADLAVLLNPGGRLLLTAPNKNCRSLLGESISDHEDGGHVRWGYTHEEIAQLLLDNDLDIVAAEYVSGFVPQQLINLSRIIGRLNPELAWASVFPLRLLQRLDTPITGFLRHPYLSIGVVAVKRQ